jgi:ADP-ribose pyrophosphatase YjhB (NUDIX family)
MQLPASWQRTTRLQHSHCSYCGVAYPPEAGWPRTCPGCTEITWHNPLPVAMVLLPVLGARSEPGLVVIRRDIEPARGELSLPGGFIETGETWQEAAVRELREETGLTARAGEVRLFDVISTPGTINVFGRLPPRPIEQLPPSAPTEEATEWLVITKPQRLAFATATDAVSRYFASA